MPKTINGEQLDPQAYRLFKAIREKESGGNYNAVGDNATSTGAFQFQGSTWKGYAKDVLGDENAPMNKGNQNQVAYKKIKSWKDAGWTPAQIAAAWNAGEQKALDGTWKENIGFNKEIGVAYNTPQYVGDVLSKAKALKSLEEPAVEQSTTQQQTTAQATPVVPDKGVGLFSMGTLKGETSYKADMGGVGAIIPNLARTAGNLPSSTAKFVRASASPVNPLDVDSSMNIGSNIVKGVSALGSIFSSNREVNKANKAGQEAEAELRRRGLAVPQDSNVRSSVVGNTISGTGSTLAKGADIYKGLGEALYNNLEQNVMGENSVSKGVGVSLGQGASEVARVGIEDPLLIPSILYAPSKVRGTGVVDDTISATSRALTQPVKSGAEFIANKTLLSPQNIQKQIDKLEDGYVSMTSGTKAGKKRVIGSQIKTSALNNAGTQGKTPMRTLAESGVVPETSGTKFNTFDQANAYRQEVKPLQELNRAGLEEVQLSVQPTSLDDLEALAIKNARTPANINAGRAEPMEKQIRSQFDTLRREYPTGKVNLIVQDDIKSARWDNVFKNKGLVDADVLAKDSEYAIAKAFQKNIEDVARKAGNTEVAQLNRDIGDRLEASKFLEALDGQTLKGGRVSKYVGTLIGSSLGQTIPGKIAGAVGGNLVADILIKSSVSSPIRRYILSKVLAENPQSYKDVVKWLGEQDTLRNNRLQLPAPAPLGSSKNPIITPSPTTYEKQSPNIVRNTLPTQNQTLLPANTPEQSIKLPESVTTERQLLREKELGLDETKNMVNNQLKSPNNQQTTNAINIDANIPTQSNTLPQKSTGVINSIKDKIKNTPNKQGGFIKLPQGKGEQSGLSAKSSLPNDNITQEIKNILSGEKPVFRAGNQSTKLSKDDVFGDVKFFADRKNMAEMYGSNVQESFVNIKKPFVISEKALKLGGKGEDQIKIVKEFGGTDKFRQYLKENGYDGIVVEKDYGNEILALNKNQINLPKNNTDLITEAKKYKSAEEFVNKVENSTTGIGSVGKIADSFDYKTIDIKPVGDMNLAKFSLGADAKYFKRAEGFGDLAKIMKDRDNNIFVYLNDGVDPNKLNKKTLANFTNSYEPWNKSASKRFITNDNGKSWQEVSAFELGSATSGMSKSQLEQIWKEANTTRLPKNIKETFIGKVEEGYKPAIESTPKGFNDFVKEKYGADVDVFTWQKDGNIELAKIIVPKANRSKGIGTSVMKDLIEHADKTGQTITLTPGGEFGGSVSRLKEFYKRFDFEKNKDLGIKGTLIRFPKKL